MCKFFATYKVDGRYTTEVSGKDIDAIVESAEQAFGDADFGEISDTVDSAIVHIEDKNGDIIYDSEYGLKNGYEIDANAKYFVRHSVDARFVAAVEAESLGDVFEAARAKYEVADFGEMEVIDGELIIIEDEKGNFVYEK